MKKRIPVDASSVILLFKADLFNDLLVHYRVIMSCSVYGEITEEGYPGSQIFRENSSDFAISAVSVQEDNPLSSQMAVFGIGERETILLYLEGKGDFVLIDDGKGAGFCKKHRIPYINALQFPRILYLAGKTSEKEYRLKTETLLKIGRYSAGIIDYALNCSEEELRFFIP